MKFIQKISNGIGLLSEWTGRTVMWLLIVLIGVIAVDVFLRYLFNRPTLWSYPIAYMTGAVLVALGLCYVHLHQGMVRVDILYTRFSPKTKLIVDTVFAIICLLPLAATLTILFGADTWRAYLTGEQATETTWYPIVWPYKALVTIGYGLLLLQAVGTLLKDIAALTKGGKEPW